ncbi:MAG: 50S ribosomal protein L4 [Chlamydiae bacterium]|nr:50S ribosomal protein L4 [Chlamydiota bacterium]
MIKLLKYNLDAKKLKDVEVDEAKLASEVNCQMIKDYIVALRKNQRQWSANTKGRSEVNHSNKKPHRQKGTGKARQGTLAAPQYKGGGVVFGPKPKFDQFAKINRKEKQAIIKYLISQKIKQNECIILSDTDMKAPKTKALAKFMSECTEKPRRLIIGEKAEATAKSLLEKKEDLSNRKHYNFQLSIRNLERTEFSCLDSVNGYQLMIAQQLIITEAGLKQFLELCK